MTQISPSLSKGVAALILFVLVVFMVAAGVIAPGGLNWIIVALAMLVFMIVISFSRTNRAGGILISDRNLMSLARFQIVVWTLIILSAYLTIALERISAGVPDPLNIVIDWRLWALMGITTTSLVGTPLIQSNKKAKEPKDDKVIEKCADALGEPKGDIDKNRQGILYANTNFSDASFTDMFGGDELANTPYIDMTKVQMFFFTIIAALSYIVILFTAILTTEPRNLGGFPVLSEGLIAILGISHAGYLTGKAVDRTPSTPA